MKKKYSIEIGLSIIFVIANIFLGTAPVGHAQSVQTWSGPINLSLSGAATNPSLVVDASGGIHVLWVDKFTGYQYSESADGGVTWTPPAILKVPFSTKKPPVLFSDDKGMIYIFWLTDKNELSYSQTLAENFSSPSAWQTVAKLDVLVFDFDVARDLQGNWHVAYVKNPVPAPGVAGVFYRRLSVGTSSWSGVQLLYESPYFRSSTPDQFRIRIAVTDKENEKKVYVVWDERAQKRIFLAHSLDGGLNWDPAQEVVSPRADLGFKTPYQSDVHVLDGKLLMTWQMGDPGARCTPFSWTSADNGASWSEAVTILSASSQCPERSEFFSIDPAYAVELFTVQGDLSISAWNGSLWSNPEIQTGPTSITNPATFDTVLLGCEQTSISQNRLFIVGCDLNPGSDIWFMSRSLDPLESLFPQPSAWSGDTTVADVSQSIASLTSITDDANNIHAFWIQYSGTAADPIGPRIMYARGNNDKWTQPAPIFSDLNRMPLNLSVQIDTQRRLLLAWVDQSTGDLLFTWASSERANIPIEWLQPVIHSPSALTNSPDIVVDVLDRIVVAYAVTLNEDRGIYIIQSTDAGSTWSAPVRVFDAVAAMWDMVDQPKLAATVDGKLHVLFTQYKLLGHQQPVGLYYSQSTDGGQSWVEPVPLSEKPVQWSEMIASSNALHRFWMENDKTDSLIYHQVSTDGGSTWAVPVKLPVEGGMVSVPSVSLDGAGDLHFLEVLQEDVSTLREWQWEGDRWFLAESRKIGIPEQELPIAVTSGVTSLGSLHALFQFVSSSDSEVQNALLNLSRALSAEKASKPVIVSIPTPSVISAPVEPVESQVAATSVSPLANLEETQTSINRNIVGLVLIVSVALVILVLTIPKRNRVADKSKRNK